MRRIELHHFQSHCYYITLILVISYFFRWFCTSTDQLSFASFNQPLTLFLFHLEPCLYNMYHEWILINIMYRELSTGGASLLILILLTKRLLYKQFSLHVSQAGQELKIIKWLNKYLYRIG